MFKKLTLLTYFTRNMSRAIYILRLLSSEGMNNHKLLQFLLLKDKFIIRFSTLTRDQHEAGSKPLFATYKQVFEMVSECFKSNGILLLLATEVTCVKMFSCYFCKTQDTTSDLRREGTGSACPDVLILIVLRFF
jgi:hypothetical protein